MDLNTAVEQYISRKRQMGRRYMNNAKELYMFARGNPGLELSGVRKAHLAKVLNQKTLSRDTWISRYSRFRAFFFYWVAKHEIAKLPMPRPIRPTRAVFSPYIFSRLQIKALLRGAGLQHRELSSISADTLRIIITLLYGTGIGPGEALALKIRDINFEKGRLRLSTRVGPARTIPICADLMELLRNYARKTQGKPDDLVFKTKDGRRISGARLNVTFRRIRRISRIKRTDGSRHQPMLKDLRHTFAVHRIAAWCRRGIDIDLMLPKLAAYMGYWTLPLAEHYLPFVPDRFRKQVRTLSARTRVNANSE